jgi:hypothetical protein
MSDRWSRRLNSRGPTNVMRAPARERRRAMQITAQRLSDQMNGTGASKRPGHPSSVAPRRQTRFSRIPRKIKMLKHPVDYETPEPVTSIEPTDLNTISLTAETIEAIADLDDDSRIEKMLRVGAAICAARKVMPHGSLTNWYRNDVKRSESWCSQYCRLFEDREKLQPAIEWATRTNQKLADARGIEQLLKTVASYKVKVLGEKGPSRKGTRADSRNAAKTRAEELIWQLRNLLAEARKDLGELHLEGATVPSSEVDNFRASLLSMIERIGQQLAALHESCSGMQVSGQHIEDRSL